MNIILYLIQLCHQLYQQNCWLINFICRYIPLKQWAFDDSHSPKYQKFKVDQLPKIVYHHQDWDRLNPYSVDQNAIFRKIAPALPARPPSLTCIATMVKPDSCCVRSAEHASHQMRAVSPRRFRSSVLTVPIR